MSNTAVSAAIVGNDMLMGSSIQPSLIKRPDYVDEQTGETRPGESVQLGEVVRHAFSASGLDSDGWNALSDPEREAKIIESLRAMQLPVMHSATSVEVLGASNMSLQQQADCIRLNPGIGGFSQEAHAQAAEDEKNGVPLPEFKTLGELHDAALQGQNAASVAATGASAPAETAGGAAASTGSPLTPTGEEQERLAAIEAQNQAAANSMSPQPQLAEGVAAVRPSPAGDGHLVKFFDKVEEHFYATIEELKVALEGYVHDFTFTGE